MNINKVYEVIRENCPYATYTCSVTGVTMREYHLYGCDVVQVALLDKRPVEWLTVSHPQNRWFIGYDLADLQRIAHRYTPWTSKACDIEMVTLPLGLQVGKYPVTQAQYYAVMGDSGSGFRGDTRPVDAVSYGAALQFCFKLADLTGIEYSIPADYEWEYAARAGTKTTWSFGDDPALLDQYAWYRQNSNRMTLPVGQKLPNPWGLYDIYGQVREWAVIEGPKGGFALCGGHYWSDESDCTSTSIDPGPEFGNNCGFRVVVRNNSDGEAIWTHIYKLRKQNKGGKK